MANLLVQAGPILKTEYVDRMKEEQKFIYFATGENLNLEEISLKETKERTNGESGRELYKASRAFIGFVQEMGIKKGSEAYEN